MRMPAVAVREGCPPWSKKYRSSRSGSAGAGAALFFVFCFLIFSACSKSFFERTKEVPDCFPTEKMRC